MLGLALALAATAGPSLPVPSSWYTGNDLWTYCGADSGASNYRFQRMQCTQYVMGVSDEDYGAPNAYVSAGTAVIDAGVVAP